MAVDLFFFGIKDTQSLIVVVFDCRLWYTPVHHSYHIWSNRMTGATPQKCPFKQNSLQRWWSMNVFAGILLNCLPTTNFHIRPLWWNHLTSDTLIEPAICLSVTRLFHQVSKSALNLLSAHGNYDLFRNLLIYFKSFTSCSSSRFSSAPTFQGPWPWSTQSLLICGAASFPLFMFPLRATPSYVVLY